jgi:hypothetical protein
MRTELRIEETDCAGVLEDLRRGIEIEARLRSVHVEWVQSLTLRATVADKGALASAWAGMLHEALDGARAGDRLSVSLTTTRVRPAIIFTVSLLRVERLAAAPNTPTAGCRQTVEKPPATLLLASAHHSARLHQGRLTILTSSQGMMMEFVAPQPV